MLITEEYRALNENMHRLVPAYGVSGKLFAGIVEGVAKTIKSWDILDYGCGKCTLQMALGRGIKNYDPCVPGVDEPPEASDIVVCTEVMEHIEPMCLEAVLDDLERLCNRVIVLTVACGPALKVLEDGRNAHLIQQLPAWWMPKLEKRWTMCRVFPTEGGFCFIGQSKRDLTSGLDFGHIGPPAVAKQIKTKSAYPAELRCKNIRSALLRGLPEVRIIPAHRNKMILVCYGPSLRDTIHDIRPERGDIYTVSGAHRLLLERGITPMGHIESDPRPHKVKLIGPPSQDVVYFLASACAREVFDHVRGHETWVYHVTSTDEETTLISQMRRGKAFTIDGGTNVGIFGCSFGTVLGYRDIEVHGMDCSFEALDRNLLNWPKGKPLPANVRERVQFHTGAHPNEDQPVHKVEVGKRTFLSSPQMMQGVQDFLNFRYVAQHVRVTLRGDGFLQALVRALDGYECSRRVA